MQLTANIHIPPDDLKIAHLKVSIILDRTLSAEAIEAELRSHLESVPGFHKAVVTLTHTENL